MIVSVLIDSPSAAATAVRFFDDDASAPSTLGGVVFETRRGRAHRYHCGICYDCWTCCGTCRACCGEVLCAREEYYPEACARVTLNCSLRALCHETDIDGDQVALSIESGLANTKRITYVAFNRCGLTKVGAQSLARAILRNTSLVELDISRGNAGIDEEGHRQLLQAIQLSRAPLRRVRGVRGWTGKARREERGSGAPGPELGPERGE
jgi:hypothetical protein